MKTDFNWSIKSIGLTILSLRDRAGVTGPCVDPDDVHLVDVAKQAPPRENSDRLPNSISPQPERSAPGHPPGDTHEPKENEGKKIEAR